HSASVEKGTMSKCGYYWYVGFINRLHLIDGLSFSDSVSLLLVQRSLTSLLPKSLFKGLASQFALAASTLSNSKELGNWSQKFASVGPELSSKPPAINENVLERVQNAVLREQQLDVQYQAIHQSEPKAYRLAPLALVLRGQVLYLLATVGEHTDVRRFAMHRMHDAKLYGAKNPEREFDLQAYLNAGGMEFKSDDASEPILFKARVRAQQANHLAEQPLSTDMQLSKVDDEWSLVTATVSDSWQLRWWIMSHAVNIEVLEPKSLRDGIKRQLSEALAHYSS
uniref:helix-turn-helix transcriptional regulator n=1 Tax=Shewanella sp. TaxID=50422 RepID=UPI003A97176F